ncbi:MFS transporter [Nitrospira defluvii]|nr:MFS transporter [Nitrospira defluvii]
MHRMEDMKEQVSPLFTRNFKLLFMAHLFFGFSFWPYVLLPVFIQDLGSNLAEVGIIMGAASVSGMIVRPWSGDALDRIGRRSCLLAGGLIFLLTHGFYLLVDQIGPFIYFVRLFHGLSMGILFATFFTFAADITPPQRRTEGIAIFGIGGHLSGAFGVPLGEFLIRSGGYPLLFKACAVFTVLFTVFSYFLKEPQKIGNQARFRLGDFFKAGFQPENRVPLIGNGLFALGLISYMVFLKPYANEQGLSVTFFFMAYSLSAVLIRLVGGKWPDQFGLKTVLYPSFVSLALGIFLLALWPSSIGLLVSGVLCGIGHGFIFPILSVLLINRGSDKERGRSMALFTLLFDVGFFIGAPLWGYIAQHFDYPAMFTLSAISALLAIVVFVFFDQKDPVLVPAKVSTDPP